MHPVAKTLLIVGLLTAWFTAAGVLGYDRIALADDLAEFVNNPVRLLHGELPYRDFWLLHPPGEVFLPAAVYRLGFNVNGVLLTNVGISVLVGLAAFCVGRIVAGRNLEGILASALVFFAGVPECCGYVQLHAYLLSLLVAAGFLAWHLRNHRRRYLLFAGLALGCGFCFRVYLAGAATAAMMAIVLLEARARNCSWRECARLLAICGSGVVLIVAVMSALLADLLPAMWHAIAIDSVSHAVARHNVYGHAIAEAWPEVVTLVERLWHNPTSAGAFWYVATIGSEFVSTATMHTVPFLAVYFWWQQCRRRGAAIPVSTAWMIDFFLIWGMLTFIRPLVRGGQGGQLSQAVTPLYFVLVLLVRPLMTRWQATKSVATGFAACTILSAVIGVGQRGLAVPVERTVVALLKEGHPVVAPYGRLCFDDRRRAGELQELLATVVEHTSQEEHVFVVPWSAPAIYALTRRRNPTYYDSTIDLFYRPSDEKQRQVCHALLAKETRLIIGRADLPGAGWDSIGKRARLPLLDDCIDEHFERFRECGRFSAYRRRAAKTGSAAESIGAPDP